MRKLLVIWLFLIIFLVGCVEPTPPGPVVDELKVSEVVDSIDILYSDIANIDFSDKDIQSEIERIKGLYEELIPEEKELVTNYNDFQEIEEQYNLYKDQIAAEEAEKAKIAKAVAEAAAYVEETVPKKSTGENLELPSVYVSDDGVEVYIGWSTNDPATITNKGLVTQPRNASKAVNLTAVCRNGSVSEKVTKRVTVGPLAYEPLPEKPVFAYYFTNQRELTELERKTINVINLSFGEISSNGTVYVTNLNYETVLQERKNGIRVCFSVQNKQGFKTWTATAEKREKLAQSFLDTCEEYHFDGVDIDWEYPESGNEVDNYVEFMKVLYNKFKAKSRNYIITSAMYGGNGVPKYKAGESCQYMDYVHLMTYDLNAAELSTHLTALSAGPASNISVESTVAFYMGAGVPKEKIIIGGAFYGKIYELALLGSSFISEKPTRDPYSIVYSKLKDDYLSQLNTNGDIKVERKWDAAANAPYLCITEYVGGVVKARKFITYDDAESLKLKAEYVFENDLGGMMFWELGYDNRETNDLVEAIYNVFYK